MLSLKTYIFEIVEVVANPEEPPNCNYKLRLLCRDDAKGPVTAICGLNGYLVSTMGQKVRSSEAFPIHMHGAETSI